MNSDIYLRLNQRTATAASSSRFTARGFAFHAPAAAGRSAALGAVV